jgi:hypothetical protein
MAAPMTAVVQAGGYGYQDSMPLSAGSGISPLNSYQPSPSTNGHNASKLSSAGQALIDSVSSSGSSPPVSRLPAGQKRVEGAGGGAYAYSADAGIGSGGVSYGAAAAVVGSGGVSYGAAAAVGVPGKIAAGVGAPRILTLAEMTSSPSSSAALSAYASKDTMQEMQGMQGMGRGIDGMQGMQGVL